MNPLERKRYLESLCAKYTKLELWAIKETFEAAKSVVRTLMSHMGQDLVIDEMIEAMKVNPVLTPQEADYMSHPAYRMGFIAGMKMLSANSQVDFTNSAQFMGDAYQEKILHG